MNNTYTVILDACVLYPAPLRSYLMYLASTLVKAEEIHYPNPLTAVDNVKVPENELSYLTHDQIKELLDETKKGDNPHVYLITKISLSTGARWGGGRRLNRTACVE